MEGGADTPRAKGVEKCCVRLFRFVAVIFVEEFTALVPRVCHFNEVIAQGLHLLLAEEFRPGQVSLIPVLQDLLL